MNRIYLNLRRGDTLPIEGKRKIAHGPLVHRYRPDGGGNVPDRDIGIWCEPDCSAHRFAIFTPRQKELAVVEAIKREGQFAFVPTRRASWKFHGRTIERDYPQIGGLIYARFTLEPQWHVMAERRMALGVISCGGRPANLSSEVFRVLQGLPTTAEALAEAKRALFEVRANDQAEIKDGPLAGLCVSVRRTAAGRAWFEHVSGLRGSVPVEKLSKTNL